MLFFVDYEMYAPVARLTKSAALRSHNGEKMCGSVVTFTNVLAVPVPSEDVAVLTCAAVTSDCIDALLLATAVQIFTLVDISKQMIGL